MIKTVFVSIIGFGLSLGITSGIVIAEQPALAVIEKLSKKDSLDKDTMSISESDTDSKSGGISVTSETSGTSDISGISDASDTSIVLADEFRNSTAVLAESASPNQPALVAGKQNTPSATPQITSDTEKPADAELISRVARIFATMPPNDAARILGAMENADLRSILFELPKKQQALILSQLPTDRAALLTKASLRRAE